MLKKNCGGLSAERFMKFLNAFLLMHECKVETNLFEVGWGSVVGRFGEFLDGF